MAQRRTTAKKRATATPGKPAKKTAPKAAPRRTAGTASPAKRAIAVASIAPSAPDPLWTTVDRYIAGTLVPQDAALTQALADSAAAGLPPISVSVPQGKLLHLLARSLGARRILEVGTLGGYSAIWLARALPSDGRLVTLEIDPKHAAVARANLERAGVAEQVEVRLGRGVDSLARLADESTPLFDLAFIDADKPSNPDYFAWALRLVRPGGVVVIDNTVRRGLVADAGSADANVLGVRRLNELIAAEPRASATTIQTVGAKGHDGFTYVVIGP